MRQRSPFIFTLQETGGEQRVEMLDQPVVRAA